MKYIFGFVAVILIVLITLVLIWRGLMGGGGAPAEEPAPLTDYAFTTTAMRLTIDGEINADEEHSAVRITLSRSENRVEILEGYDYAMTDSRSYASNQEAYGNYLRALDLMGFTEGADSEEMADERGVCPTGERYTYEIVDGTDVKQRYWSTSCRTSDGTFLGESREVQKFFRALIPDYRDLTRGVL